MPKPPPGPKPDPMARVVDRLLAQLPGLQESPAVVNTSSPRFPTVVTGGAVSRRPASTATHSELIGVWVRVLLGLTLAVTMAGWPYSRSCGLPLFGYLCAVITVMLGGGWAAVASWKFRVGLAHLVSLILVFYGFLLGAAELLPRTGYSVNRATWQCEEVVGDAGAFSV